MKVIEKKKVRQETDALIELIVARIGVLVETEVEARMSALTEEILERLPEVVHIPPRPVDAPRERLMPLREVAEVLGCSEDTVKSRMAAGQLAWIAEQGAKERKVPYSWVLEYIYSHKRYTGPFRRRRELADGEGIGADCAAIVQRRIS